MSCQEPPRGQGRGAMSARPRRLPLPLPPLRFREVPGSALIPARAMWLQPSPGDLTPYRPDLWDPRLTSEASILRDLGGK